MKKFMRKLWSKITFPYYAAKYVLIRLMFAVRLSYHHTLKRFGAKGKMEGVKVGMSVKTGQVSIRAEYEYGDYTDIILSGEGALALSEELANAAKAVNL